MRLGTKIVLPIPSPTLKERGASLVKGFSKNFLYDPDRRRVLPQSMLWSENLPQVKNGKLSPEDMQKAIGLVSGFSMAGGLQPGRAVKMGGMLKGSFTRPSMSGKFVKAPAR